MNQKLFAALTVSILSLGFALPSHADTDWSLDQANMISSVEVKQIADFSDMDFAGGGIGAASCKKTNPRPFFDTDPVDDAGVVVDKIINIGKKIWTVIEAGRPVVDLQYDVATALPEGAGCWLDLQQWSIPKSAAFVVSYKNMYGVEMVHLTYRVLYLAGGNVRGIGRYVGYAAVQPADVRVSWGYDLNVRAAATAIYNQGTSKNPVGGLQLQITWTLKNVFQHFTQSQIYAIDGTGTLTVLK